MASAPGASVEGLRDQFGRDGWVAEQSSTSERAKNSIHPHLSSAGLLKHPAEQSSDVKFPSRYEERDKKLIELFKVASRREKGLGPPEAPWTCFV